MADLVVENLHVEVEGKEVLKGVNLEVNRGEVNVLMGPNGSGKTTLSLALMGHPKYKITKGRILLEGEDITGLEPHERARKGLFLAFQNPIEISGVRLSTLLTLEANRVFGSSIKPEETLSVIRDVAKRVGLSESLLNRNVFEGFSGGEKKRTEIAQMLLLKPKIAILDEPDSGVDVDGLKIIADNISKLLQEKGTGFLIITHYRRILEYVKPTKVHVMYKGKIVVSGGEELSAKIDREGYESVVKGAV
ncbi:MAG: Fe-S cluster assembly ATPase SufC [Sulfolobaceae archaeon]|jgi:Fe-S cluster assembly ATP-binding protein|nr:Fe-S cluster assembly ATPase SufC [Sulfolobales archaeon]MDT7899034.1 Fe-S cluster assembly ATPase SufC [Sulfolobales archaeon]